MKFSVLTMISFVRHCCASLSLFALGQSSHLYGGLPSSNRYTSPAQRRSSRITGPSACCCCNLKIFERLVLKRLLPHIAPQIDETQAGFRWGAEEQVYTLAETLRLRRRKRTFCGFVDVRKAFDVAWRNAVLVKLAEAGITGSMWKVLDDLLTGTSARVVVNGLLSQPWAETAGVRQGSVLGPLLFTILFDSISATVLRACPGVALGGPGTPKVTLLLYADDLVVLADSVQHALDAIGAWGARWRFSFGIGPDKTAVLVVGCRTRNFNFTLNDVPVPVVPEYCYLGVVFQSSRKWSKHGERLYTNSNRKFHQFPNFGGESPTAHRLSAQLVPVICAPLHVVWLSVPQQ